jgi:hypothetical protein
VCDIRGNVVASASGCTPWWSQGIFAAELWALLSASQNAFPGSLFVVDCKAVQMGSINGLSWAAAPNRLLARSWIPIASMLADSSSYVIWMPAHCSEAAVGVSNLSNGRVMTLFDLQLNDYVDKLAKDAAKMHAPPKEDLHLIVSTTRLVRQLALWIGQCTVLANHFPVYDDGKKRFIRDTGARRLKRVASTEVNQRAIKRKASSQPSISNSLSSVPSLSKQPVVTVKGEWSFAFSKESTPLPKRMRYSQKQADQRCEATFQATWLERIRARPVVPPPVNAASRMQAIREKVGGKHPAA